VARLLPWSRLLVVLDVLIVVVLFLAALPVRWEATRGDLWMDEASYALASVRGWEANRWDLPSPDSADPLQLVRLRHWHPPLTVQLMHLATSLWGSTSEQTLRAPSVIVGGLIVVLVYLCGLSLFRRPHSPGAGVLVTRWAALVCACIVLFTPGQIGPPHTRCRGR
jgi:4-amino-4-deoxy-L-arabinose transferase-like glycosyltransferase